MGRGVANAPGGAAPVSGVPRGTSPPRQLAADALPCSEWEGHHLGVRTAVCTNLRGLDLTDLVRLLPGMYYWPGEEGGPRAAILRLVVTTLPVTRGGETVASEYGVARVAVERARPRTSTAGLTVIWPTYRQSGDSAPD